MARNVRIELLLYFSIALFSAAVMVEASKLPPGTFDPIGSGPVPMGVSGIIILLCVLGVASRWRHLSALQDDHAERYGPMVCFACLMVVYVSLLMTRLVDYSLLTFFFVTVAIWGFERFARSRLLAAAIVAAVLSFGGQYIFVKILFVDLPRWY